MENLRRRYSDKIFDAIPGYISVQNRELRLTAANDAFRKDFGDIEGRYCYQVYKQRPEKCENCPVERTFHDGQKHQSEEIVRTIDGREVHVLVNTTPIRNDSGEVTDVIEMSTDITELKNLQIQLTESRQRYRQLFEEVPCFISIQDRDLRIIEANRLHREAFGTSYGSKCYEVYKHRTEECYPCVVKKTFEDGDTHIHEEVVTSKAGVKINVLVFTMPIKDQNGEIESVIEMSTDITQIRQLQSKLESIGLLISSISHGLKGLLSSLDGGFYLVNTGLEKNNEERVKKGWEIAQRNVERIRSMVLDILYYAKDREPNWESISAAEMTKEIHGIMLSKAENLNVKLELINDKEDEVFEADRKAVHSMLVNLVENSLDACRVDDKKGDHKVTVVTRNSPDYVEFEISDNGIGMDRETREKAFSLFFSSKGTEGTGLGLFIANKIAQEHGGSIKVESEANVGTRFHVKLPKKRLEKEPEISEIAVGKDEEDEE
ncbi:MAG: PAS domain-containing sensor histidine kinase [Candidatus Zixiibacteriota bacterium]|nr:MAG: PAS domain-containing sensor histidine kinase [candidate division Zixibacteria bacterium]